MTTTLEESVKYSDLMMTKQSQIQRYFSGTTILITGATGFVGKLLVEKLLRTCSNVERVYILIREKKGKSPEKRFEELLNSIVFERVKCEHPKFSEKISIMVGDCVLPDLGLNSDNKQKLINEVDCVFHCAANVRFNEIIKTAAYSNVRATRDLLLMAKQMKKLTSFIYVSTAYSHSPRSEIKEEMYDPPITGENLLTLVETLNDSMLDKITPALIGDWPNTYSFTKAVAEQVVQTEGEGLPVAIVRPSIIIATATEPVAGWIDNVYGATGIFVGVALGLIHTLHCNQDLPADLVPADYLINCTIAAAWNASLSKNSETPKLCELDATCQQKSQQMNQADVQVYNYVSSRNNSLTWKVVEELVTKENLEIPTILSIWHPFGFTTRYYYIYMLYVLFLHKVPAYIADFLMFCVGHKPRLVEGYKKIDKFSAVLSYFMCREWRFHNSNTRELWKKLTEEDQKNFEFDLDALDWKVYFSTYLRGGRMYLLKDPLETAPKARVKHFRLKIIHYTVVGLLLLGLVKLLMTLWNVIF